MNTEIENIGSPENGTPIRNWQIFLDLSKWLVGTVGVTIAITLINSGLKKRELEITELGEYHKNLQIIINEGPEERRKMAQFYTIVSTNDGFREAWRRYLDTVNLEIKQNKAEIDALERQSNELDENNPEDKEKIQVIKKKQEALIKKFNSPIIMRPLTKSDSVRSILQGSNVILPVQTYPVKKNQ